MHGERRWIARSMGLISWPLPTTSCLNKTRPAATSIQRSRSVHASWVVVAQLDPPSISTWLFHIWTQARTMASTCPPATPSSSNPESRSKISSIRDQSQRTDPNAVWQSILKSCYHLRAISLAKVKETALWGQKQTNKLRTTRRRLSQKRAFLSVSNSPQTTIAALAIIWTILGIKLKDFGRLPPLTNKNMQAALLLCAKIASSTPTTTGMALIGKWTPLECRYRLRRGSRGAWVRRTLGCTTICLVIMTARVSLIDCRRCRWTTTRCPGYMAIRGRIRWALNSQIIRTSTRQWTIRCWSRRTNHHRCRRFIHRTRCINIKCSNKRNLFRTRRRFTREERQRDPWCSDNFSLDRNILKFSKRFPWSLLRKSSNKTSAKSLARRSWSVYTATKSAW